MAATGRGVRSPCQWLQVANKTCHGSNSMMIAGPGMPALPVTSVTVPACLPVSELEAARLTHWQADQSFEARNFQHRVKFQEPVACPATVTVAMTGSEPERQPSVTVLPARTVTSPTQARCLSLRSANRAAPAAAHRSCAPGLRSCAPPLIQPGTRFACNSRMSVCFLTRTTCKNVRQNLIPRATAYC